MVTWQSSIFCTRCFWQKYGCASFATKSDDNPTREIISTFCRRLTFSILNSYPTVNSHKKRCILFFKDCTPFFIVLFSSFESFFYGTPSRALARNLRHMQCTLWISLKIDLHYSLACRAEFFCRVRSFICSM